MAVVELGRRVASRAPPLLEEDKERDRRERGVERLRTWNEAMLQARAPRRSGALRQSAQIADGASRSPPGGKGDVGDLCAEPLQFQARHQRSKRLWECLCVSWRGIY